MKTTRNLLLAPALVVGLFTPPIIAKDSGAAVWPRPTIVPEPVSVAGVAHPVISLSGIWKVNATPRDNYWSNDVDPAAWMDIRVQRRPPGWGCHRGPAPTFTRPGFTFRPILPANGFSFASRA